MANCDVLRWYGGMVLVVTGLLIVVPYLRGKSNLISAWNLLLLGIAIFVGLGCFEAANYPIRFHGQQWFQPSVAEVNWLMAALSVFLISLIASYYFDPLSRAVTARSMNRWPPVSAPLIFYVLAVCFIIIAAVPVVWGIPFIGETLLKMNHKAIVFAPVFAFVLWHRSKLNFAWLVVFVVVFCIAVVLALLSGGGRRLPISVLFGPIVVIYMAHLRTWRPTRAMVIVGIAAVGIFILATMYNAIRHFNVHSAWKSRTATGVIEEFARVGERDWFTKFAQNKLYYFAQQNIHYSLITQRFISGGELVPQPLNTLKVIATYPIPRRLWKEKPRILGIVILTDVVGWPGTTTWGCGIGGQVAYEGGLLVAALYGYLAAFGIRMIDDPLGRQPTNPFLIGILATASTHILAWPRGDLFNMTMESAQCVLFAVILGLSARLFFGTERTWDVTRQGHGVSFIRRVPLARR